MSLKRLLSKENETDWALWKVEESQDELYKLLNDSTAGPELDQINHPQKRLEWLASRLVIKKLVENLNQEFPGIYKDAFGKPHLYQLPFHISIAHCYPYAVGALHDSLPIGIDIEQPRDKLIRIRDRFLNNNEIKLTGNDINLLCKFWSGKEVLYKIYGRKKLVFKENIHIDIDPSNEHQLIGRVVFGKFDKRYTIKTDYIDGHYISIGN